MEHTKFRNAAKELQMRANALPGVIEDNIKQCIDALEHQKHPDDASPEQMAELILRQISKNIEGVISSFDSTLESINMPPRYLSFFHSLDLTDKGWRQLLKVLNDYRGEPA